MVLPSTVVLTMDNSGARRIRCICIYEKPGISFSFVGDLLHSIVVRLRNRGLMRVAKGEFHKCVVTRISGKIFRKTRGYFFQFDKNRVIVLNKKLLPFGTRLFGPITNELFLRKSWGRLLTLCFEIL